MVKDLKEFSIPIAIVFSGLIIAGAFIFVNRGKGQDQISENGLSTQEVAQNALDYINQNILAEGLVATLTEAIEEGGVYKIHLKIGEEEYDSYVTKDGKILFPQGIDLEKAPIAQTPEAETSQPPSENTISLEELTQFTNCLKEANLVIYGANWCGWTQRLVEMLGGFDIVKPIYVECTEEGELCDEKGITGYPTILIKGEKYERARTFEEIAVATSCEVPSGAEFISGENSEGGGCQ